VKRQRIDIKKIIKKKIESRHQRFIFIDKKIKRDEMNERTLMRLGVDKSKLIKVDLVTSSNQANSQANIELSGGTFVNGEKERVSIIITAHKTQDYVEQCLDSIENQTYFINNNNFEVLVGVDACQETLDKLIQIRGKYRNLRIFMMKKNKGTYITSNTLIGLTNNENIIRFDSDDIMMTNMVAEIMQNVNNYNVIRFKYLKLVGSQVRIWNHVPHGVIYIKNSTFKMLGGYQPWMCAADTELLRRGKSFIKELIIDKPLFYRRMRENSLTASPEFGVNSEIRKNYRRLIGKHDEIKIKKTIGRYVEC